MKIDKNIVFIGFDIEGTGGISTYSRYQIKALRESFSNVKVYTLDQLEKKYSGFCDVSIPYTSKLELIKLLFKMLKDSKETDFFIFNHINLSFLGGIVKKINGIKYMFFGYNEDVLVDLTGLYRSKDENSSGYDPTPTTLPILSYRFGVKNASALGIDCQYTIDRLPEFHKYLPPVHLLYDPIDTDFFVPMPQDEAKDIISKKYNLDLSDKFIVTTIALMRGIANKGHRIIIDTIKKMDNKKIIYFITSGGEDKKNIEQYVKDAGMQDQVIFFGFVDNDLIPTFYNASDLVALISKNEYAMGEGVPLGLIEASSCEVPVLAGNEDGSIEAISDKYPNGFRVSPRSVDEIAEKIQYYMDNPQMREIHGKNGRKFIMEDFEYNKFRAKQTQIINSAL